MIKDTSDIVGLLQSIEKRLGVLEHQSSITRLTLGVDGYLQIPLIAGDPSSPANGDIWYNSTANTFKCRQNGATKTFTTS